MHVQMVCKGACLKRLIALLSVVGIKLIPHHHLYNTRLREHFLTLFLFTYIFLDCLYCVCMVTLRTMCNFKCGREVSYFIFLCLCTYVYVFYIFSLSIAFLVYNARLHYFKYYIDLIFILRSIL